MKIRIWAAAVAMTILGFTANAKPAMRGFQTVRQPDGTSLRIQKVGDEWMHFTLNEAGEILTYDDDGYYRLAKVDARGGLVSTGVKAGSREAAGIGVKLTDLDLEDLSVKRAADGRRRAPQSGLGLSYSTYPRLGSPKGLIILVEYSDVKFDDTYDGKTYFNEMINGKNFDMFGGTGSALEYFTEQSGGKFTPSFDVLGPVTLPHNQYYYGHNDYRGIDENAHLMLVDAVDILDPTVDFSIYDTDGDGVVDNVYIIYAGQGEASYGNASTVWPHSWDLSSAYINKRVDGVRIDHYACSNEWEKNRPDGVGTFIHEFSHVMGLPDLYHTTNSNAEYTPGEYSVLDYGPYNNEGRTPPNYGAYERNAMGWNEPIMLDENMTVTLNNISSGEFGLIPTSKTSEFFLLENRQLEGWDKYLPNHGLLIWHIDYVKSVFDNNVVNNTRSHQYVDIVEANNNPDYDYAEGFTFPGTTGKNSFTSETVPALKDWSGNAIDLPVTDISEHDGLITFDVAGGGVYLKTPAPLATEWSEAEMNFLIEWEPVEGATEYLLTVYGPSDGPSGELSTAFDNSNVGEGWTASDTDFYTTSSNFGVASPSFKFSKNNATLTSPAAEADITKISFWAKGQSSVNTSLRIEGLVDADWVTLETYAPQNGRAENVSIDVTQPGVRQIRFVMVKVIGNVAIDDITVTYGGGMEPLPEWDGFSVGTVTSYKVEGLDPENKEYAFTVTAVGEGKQRVSGLVYVTIEGEKVKETPDDEGDDGDEGGNNGGNGGGNSEVSGINTDLESSPVYYNLQGARIERPAPGSIVIEKRGDKVRKIKI